MISLPIWAVVLILLLIPGLVVLGIAYWHGTFRRHPHFCLQGMPSDSPHLIKTFASMSDSLITQGDPVAFRSSIEEIQAFRLTLIEQAKDLIQFETFKMSPGRRADDFADALCRRAIAGVTVQILVDSYGAHELPESYWKRLTQAGVELRFFNPFSARSPQDFLQRNHRKLLIVDQKTALVGGAGISDMWDGKDGKSHHPWYDFEIQWRGQVVGLLSGFFWQHWLTAGGPVDLRNHVPELAVVDREIPVLVTPGEAPSVGDSPIRSLFQLCIASAQQRLWLASPYLLPDHYTCRVLREACQQGVDVRILTMGPMSDKDYVYYTSRLRYGLLLESGVQIYEFQPSMMHGKVILIDQNWMSFGSANLDPRSFFHNDELNLCAYTPELMAQVETFFVNGFEQSERVDYQQWQQRSLQERVIGRVCHCLYWQL
ncbi:MAG: phosphatidylserine/phosphatidylglycerophosphate/cardiolipin synthase family protein [Leptolyngbyaceae cyanobacterium]